MTVSGESGDRSLEKFNVVTNLIISVIRQPDRLPYKVNL